MRRTAFFAFGTAVLLLSACATEPDPAAPAAPAAAKPAPVEGATAKTYKDGAFWEGDVCAERTRNGRLRILPDTSCPPRT